MQLVPYTGFEPVRPKALVPKTSVSAIPPVRHVIAEHSEASIGVAR